MDHEVVVVGIEDVECIQETPLALLCRFNGYPGRDLGEDLWIPKSQISESSDVREVLDEGTLVMAEWLAVEEGLL
jgi:hypothetical protein